MFDYVDNEIFILSVCHETVKMLAKIDWIYIT